LLAATEERLTPIAVRVAAGTLQGSAEIGLAVGATIDTFKVKKHIGVDMKERHFAFGRRAEKITREAELDGIYILRASLSDAACAAENVVRSYKQLSSVERVLRTLKDADLEIWRLIITSRSGSDHPSGHPRILCRTAFARSLGFVLI
jgi:hypothetical protein